MFKIAQFCNSPNLLNWTIFPIPEESCIANSLPVGTQSKVLNRLPSEFHVIDLLLRGEDHELSSLLPLLSLPLHEESSQSFHSV